LIYTGIDVISVDDQLHEIILATPTTDMITKENQAKKVPAYFNYKRKLLVKLKDIEEFYLMGYNTL
jgi:hypothetical protein